MKYGCFFPAPLTRVNDYLTTTSAIASPLYSRHTFTRASHGLMTCRSQTGSRVCDEHDIFDTVPERRCWSGSPQGLPR